MTREEIIAQVKIRMDEIGPFDSGEVVNNELIDEVINESAISVLDKLPIHICSPIGSGLTIGTPDSDDPKIGSIPLPDDFLRLGSLQMQEWKRSVASAITEENPIYNLQKNKYTRGGIARPVAAIITYSTGSRIEYYSVSTSHNIKKFTYIERRLPENFADKLVEPLAWQTAADCFIILEMPNQAKLCLEKLQEFINRYSY